jgi:methionyl-tRNA formyltransferase
MKILVIIDNLVQYEKVKKIFLAFEHLINFTVDFKHSIVKSAIWDHKDFIDANSTIDVKKDCDLIIENYNLVISIHCFQFFPKKLVENVRCINIHPGFNPVNRGWYPQVFSIINNLPIGATIHEMDAKLDNGPIIAREFVEKFLWDTSKSIYDRVLEKEMELFYKNFISILNNEYIKILPENNGNFFSKIDFENLLHLDLFKEGTFFEFYNLLRALSHGDYKNAYIINPDSEQKIFIKLIIEHE